MDSHRRIKLIANYAGFQLGWFLLVLTRSPWALLWVLGFVLLHWIWLGTRREWLRMGVVMGFGLAIDTLWQQSPWVHFHGAGWPVPAWLTGLWLMFPLTLNHSLGWLQGRTGLQMLFGAIGGGGSYLAGVGLGAASLAGPAYILLPLGWALWLPLFYAWSSVDLHRPGRMTE